MTLYSFQIYFLLNGGTCLAKFDLVEAYLRDDVASKSRELLTISTHRGLFQYTRLPFCVETTPDIFQQITDTIILGLFGTIAYLGDIITVGRSPQELQEDIIALLQFINKYGPVFELNIFSTIH